MKLYLMVLENANNRYRNNEQACSKQNLHNHAIFCWDKPTTIPYPVATYVLLKHLSSDKRLETIIIGK